jgi:hypothetical protein
VALAGSRPPGLQGLVKFEWVEAGSVEEMRMSNSGDGYESESGGAVRTEAGLVSM